MHWVKLTQANTGITVYVNMDLVAVIVPRRQGGSNLMLTVREPSPKSGKDTARIVPVLQSQAEVMELLEAQRRG